MCAMHCAQARLLPHVLHRCLHPWTSANMCALQIYVRANMCICICMLKYEIQSFDFVVIGGTTSTPRRCTSTLSSTPTRKQPNARRPSWIDALRLGRQLIGAAWHDVHVASVRSYRFLCHMVRRIDIQTYKAILFYTCSHTLPTFKRTSDR